ncbi:Sulfite exporter TauE/SafE [compost metagenome]
MFGVSQVVAQGLSLALAAPSTAVALATYAGHGQVDWSTGVPLAVGGLLGIGWGVRLAHTLPPWLLRGLFTLFLLLSALLLGLKA